MKTVIAGGLVWYQGSLRRLDLSINEGKVEKLGPELDRTGAEVVDASGLWVLPGAIDPHVHLAESMAGVSTADDFFTGTRSAAAGGTTTIIDFCEPQPGEAPLVALERRMQQAEDAIIDYGFHFAFTEDYARQLECIGRLWDAGITTFKAFLAYPGLALTPAALYAVLEAVGARGGMLLLHAELGDVADLLRNRYLGQPARAHALSRPAFVESAAIELALGLARAAGTRLYVVHVSSAAGLLALERARSRRQKVHGETCPHYLEFSTGHLEGPGGAAFIMSPPLREPEDAAALWQGLKSGSLEVLATDHCPFPLEAKLGPSSFDAVPNGVGSLGLRPSYLFSAGVYGGRLGLGEFVRLTTENPARLFGLWPQKGMLAPGSDADLVLWDPSATWTMSQGHQQGGEDHSLYQGMEFAGQVAMTMARGDVIYCRDRGVCAPAGRGRYLVRGLPSPILRESRGARLG
ncbi:MAG: dihydropyrimidinase [Bacillota bacterium]